MLAMRVDDLAMSATTAADPDGILCEPDFKLHDEPGRMAALTRYDVLDKPGDRAFDAIAAMVRTVCDVPSAAISLVDVDRQWFLSRHGIDPEETPRDIAFCTHTIAGRDALLVSDARDDARFRDSPLVTGAPYVVSYAGVPLVTPDGYNLGALCAVDYRPRQFGAAHAAAMHKLAAMVVDQFEWQQIERRDPLTSALSRRAFLAKADDLIWQRDWCNLPSSLIVFDIDNFRAVNTQYGHQEGDAILREIVRRSVDSVLDLDVVARIGGDSFALLQIGAVGSRALVIAEALRSSIAGLRFAALPDISVTASFGVAEISLETHDGAAWLSIAQHWLRAAKRAGGNRCGIDPRSLPQA